MEGRNDDVRPGDPGLDRPPSGVVRDGDEFRLEPPRGLSPAERESIARFYPPVTPTAAARPSNRQFRIRSLILLTLAIAIGLAGHKWMPASLFAAVLAVAANVIMFRHAAERLSESDDHPWLNWLIVASLTAVVVALLL